MLLGAESNCDWLVFLRILSLNLQKARTNANEKRRHVMARVTTFGVNKKLYNLRYQFGNNDIPLSSIRFPLHVFSIPSKNFSNIKTLSFKLVDR